ncbi:MAG: calcium/sodium antiporter [Ruminococcus sp.]|nr:calcium/sodium antiporter [Ruminococcus sp.]
MSTVLPYILLVFGFFILVKGADFFVEGSSSIAKRLNIPDIIVGLTIVAMGTSAPEAAVSITAAFNGSSGIAIGNVVGSNILNLLLVLGVAAVILPLSVDKSIFKRDFPFLIVTSILLPILCLLFNLKLGRIAGAILFAVFVTYMILTIKSALAYRKSTSSSESGEQIKILPVWKSLLYTIGGAVVIVLGGNLSVESATDIAKQLGISDALIGLTVVAIGTSLPELVTSVVAAKKGSTDMALGNVIGSNLFNILFILSITSLICPFKISMESVIDQLILLAITIYVFICAFTKRKIVRLEGISFLLIYAAYTTYIIIR